MAQLHPLSISKAMLDEIFAAPTVPVGDHLSDWECAAYVTEQVADIDMVRIDAHLASCIECCRELETLLDLTAVAESEITSRIESAAAEAATFQTAKRQETIIELSASEPEFGPLEIARYLAGQSPVGDAIREYLKRLEKIGRNLLESVYVVAIADLLNLAVTTGQQQEQMRVNLKGPGRHMAHVLMEAGAIRSTDSPDAKSGITTAAVLAMAVRTHPALAYYSDAPVGSPLTVVTSDQSSKAEITLHTEDAIRFRAVSSVEYSGRQILVEMLSEFPESIHVTVQLKEREGADEAVGETVVTRRNAELLFRSCAVLIAWLPD